MSVSQSGTSRAVPGVIDTLGAAYATLNRQPYVTLALVAFDLLYWLGPTLSPDAFTRRVTAWLAQAGADEQTQALLLELGSQFGNLLLLLSLVVPTLVVALGAGRFPEPQAVMGTYHLAWWLVPPVSLLLAVTGVFVGIGYLSVLARIVRGHRVVSRELLRAALRNGFTVLLVYLVLIGLFVLVTVPVLVTGALSVALGIGALVLPLASVFLFAASVAVFVLTYFVEEAVVWSQAAPLRALYLSYHVVRAHFWQAIRLMFAVTLIQTGAPIVLGLFARTPWGVPFAVVSYAYLVSGLALATMLFYRDRVTHVLSQRASHQATSIQS